MEDADDQKELQLLPAPHTIASSSHVASLRLDSSSIRFRSRGSSADHHRRPFEGSSTLDLQLSISLRPITPASDYHVLAGPICEYQEWKEAWPC